MSFQTRTVIGQSGADLAGVGSSGWRRGAEGGR